MTENTHPSVTQEQDGLTYNGRAVMTPKALAVRFGMSVHHVYWTIATHKVCTVPGTKLVFVEDYSKLVSKS